MRMILGIAIAAFVIWFIVICVTGCTYNIYSDSDDGVQEIIRNHPRSLNHTDSGPLYRK